MPFRYGLLSTARINDLVLAAAAKSPSVEVVAVASRDAERARTYARERGLERAHGRYEDLLADPDVDAVYVSLPNELHVEWSVRALEAGKHVLCEKPMSPHPEEVERAFDAAERSGRVLMEAFMWRHLPQTQRLKMLVDGGAVGRLRLIRASFSFPAVDPADERLLRGPQGGSLLDVGCYCVNGGRLLAGEPHEVFAAQVENENGVDLVLAATMRFADGVLLQFDSGLNLPEREHLEVVGEEATLVLDDPWHAYDPTRPVIELRRTGHVERIEFPPADAYRLELENLAEAALGRAQPLLGRADALGQAQALEALLRSAREGVPVRLD